MFKGTMPILARTNKNTIQKTHTIQDAIIIKHKLSIEFVLIFID